MKLGWVTHHLPRDTDSDNPAHLPGKYVGGAEMTDATLIAAAPDGVDVVLIPPDRYETAFDCDDIVVTGTDMLTDDAMRQLAEHEPVVFLHHLQTRYEARRDLINGARLLIVHTPAHLAHEQAWTQPKRTALVLSPLDVSECFTVTPKKNQAVWANRMHDLKGPRTAAMWAATNDIPLVKLSNVPRAEVLHVMAESKYFVHLPIGFESESRATIEAVLSGCEIIANDNVGVTSVPGWQDTGRLADLVTNAAERWWRKALQ
jgi:hypothetical protein